MTRAWPVLLLAAACGLDEPKVVFDMTAGATWPQPPLLPPATGPRLAFTDSGDDTLFFADAGTFAEVGRVPVGTYPLEREGPHHLAVSPDGRFLYVGISNVVPLGASSTGPHGSHGQGTDDGYLLQIDAVTGREVARVRVGRSPGDVRLEPSGLRIWQTHYDRQKILEVLSVPGPPDYTKMNAPVVVIEVPAMKKVATLFPCPANHGLAFSEARGEAYVACEESDQVAVIDIATLELKGLVAVGPDPGLPLAVTYSPYALVADPVTGFVWASNIEPQHRGLRVVDPAALAEVPALALPTEGAPFFGDFTADGSRLYLATQAPDRLLEIDPAVPEVLRQVELGPLGCENAHVAKLSPDESVLWIVCEGDHVKDPGSLEVLVTASLAPRAHLPLGLYPDDVVLLPGPP